MGKTPDFIKMGTLKKTKIEKNRQ